MYIPETAIPLNKVQMPQIRLGLQGYPGTGKTWFALTFPNCIVLSFDRGLGAHIGRSDVYEIPFWDDSFVDKIFPRKVAIPPNPANRKAAFEKWMTTEATKFTDEQTLVIDGVTALEIAYDKQTDLEPSYTKSGQIDDFAFWRRKIAFFDDLGVMIKSLKCHVILISHETAAKDKKTQEYTGKLRPLLTGQSGDKIGGNCTDWVRQLAANKPADNQMEACAKNFGMTVPELKIELAKFPRQTMYYFQTESDDLCDCKISSLVNFPRYIFASFDNFKRYMKKPV